MNKTKIIIPVILLLVLTGFFAIANDQHWFGWNNNTPGKARDGKEELRKLYSRYNQADSSWHINGTIRLYDGEKNNGAQQEETSFNYIKKGLEFYSSFGYTRMISGKDLVIQIDTLNKYIVISKPVAMEDGAVKQTAFPFEKFMNEKSDFKIEASVSEHNDERTLVLNNELTPEIKYCSIVYDTANYQIRRCEIAWWKDALPGTDAEAAKKVWLTRIEYHYLPPVDLSTKDKIDEVITVKNNQIIPVGIYKDYQVEKTF